MGIDGVTPQPNTITVIAAGEVRARANVMHLVFEVRTRASTAAEALRENNARDRAVRLRLRGLGIHEESIDASGVSFVSAAGDGVVLPGTMEPQGFVAVRTLAINSYIAEEDNQELSARVAQLLDEAADGGAQAGARQQVNLAIFRSPCVTFALDRDEEERGQALHRAMTAARMAAEQAVRPGNMEIDEIVSTQILELGALIQPRWAAGALNMPGLEAPRPQEAGRVSVRAVVSVTYRVRHAPRPHESLGSGPFTLEQADSTAPGHSAHKPELL